MNQVYTVYKHTNKLTKKVYIGITSRTMEERWGDHVRSSKRGDGFKFQRAIVKYGEDSFEHEVLTTTHSLNEAKLLEIEYIQQYDSYNNGYNATLGGDGSCERTDEWKLNKSIEMKTKLLNGDIISPFADKDIHRKSIDTRTSNGTNIFVTSNPMFDEESKIKKALSMPDMKGRKQWVNIVTGEKRQCAMHPEPECEWVQRGFMAGKITKAKGKAKKKVQCPYCDMQVAPHALNRHIKGKHENN